MTADRAIQRFLDRHVALASPTSKRVTISRGWKWAEKCCEGGTRVSKLIDPKMAGRPGLGPEHWIERCSKCGGAWGHEAVEEMPFKRRPKEPSGIRVDAAEDRMVELGDLAVAIWTTPNCTFNRAPMTGEIWLEHLAILLAQVVAGGTARAIADTSIEIESIDRMTKILLGADVPPALVASICEHIARPRQQGTVEKWLARARREIEARLRG